jgi:hypothetical protein
VFAQPPHEWTRASLRVLKAAVGAGRVSRRMRSAALRRRSGALPNRGAALPNRRAAVPYCAAALPNRGDTLPNRGGAPLTPGQALCSPSRRTRRPPAASRGSTATARPRLCRGVVNTRTARPRLCRGVVNTGTRSLLRARVAPSSGCSKNARKLRPTRNTEGGQFSLAIENYGSTHRVLSTSRSMRN